MDDKTAEQLASENDAYAALIDMLQGQVEGSIESGRWLDPYALRYMIQGALDAMQRYSNES